MKKFFIISIFVVALFSCNKQVSGGIDEVAFAVSGVEVDAFVDTRVTVVDASSLNSSGIRVSATTGSAGSETAAWTNVLFTKVGSYFTGDQYWPDTNANPLHFYASNQALNFTAAGATVNATNTTDVVCAYMPSPTFKGVNTLVFDHIFARLGEVTFSAAPDFTVTGISVTIVPQTGGTYNLRTGYGHTDGTGWSSVTVGSATAITNSTPGTKVNDLYLVPGTYTITASWTATAGDFSKTYTNKTYDVNLVAGKVNTITAALGSDAEDVKFSVEVEPWGALAIAAGEFPVQDLPATFGGLMIAPAPLKYTGSTFAIVDDDWNHESWGTVYGMNEGSYYFSFIDLGKCFDSEETSFSNSSGNINADNRISYGGYNDWRLPTYDEVLMLLTSSSAIRIGSTVNGSENKHYAIVNLPGTNFANSGENYFYGLLIFPDNKIITGKAFTVLDSNTITDGFVVSDIDEYISQGCAFIPAAGRFMSAFSNWWNGQSGLYWTSTESTSDYTKACSFQFNYQGLSYSSNSSKELYMPVRLVRDAS